MADLDNTQAQNIKYEALSLPIHVAINYQTLQEDAPNLARLIDNSIRTVNKHSSKDKNADRPDYVVIYDKHNPPQGNEGLAEKNGAFIYPNVNGKSFLFLDRYAFLTNSVQSIRGAVQHEVTHDARFRTHPELLEIYKKDAPLALRRREELTTDRGGFSIDVIHNNLDTIRAYPVLYDYPSSKMTHPNCRDRIEAALKEAYGDGIFRGNGSFNNAGDFRPVRHNGVAVTENGNYATNWDNVSKAIDARVRADLKLLDGLVKNGLSDAEQQQFIDHFNRTVPEFRAKHPVKLEDPKTIKAGAPPQTQHVESAQLNSGRLMASNAQNQPQYLAERFREFGNSNVAVMEENVSMDARMKLAHLALQVHTQDINATLKLDSSRESAISMVQNKIADGIALNKYPDLDTHKEVTASQSA